MSHSTVLVVLPPSGDPLADRIAAALAPFDENTEVESYIETDRAGHIANFRETQDRWRENRARYLADPDGYGASGNPSHLAYLLDGEPIPSRVPADKTLGDEWSDDEIWSWLLKVSEYERQAYGEPKFDGDGNSWSTYNPRSKWDWWALGGRWPNSLALMDGTSGQDGELSWVFSPKYADAESIAEALPRAGVADAALACEVDWDKTEPTFALLDTAGEWHERGHMGWWGIVTDETPADHWEQRWRSLTDLVPPDHTVAVVDVHI